MEILGLSQLRAFSIVPQIPTGRSGGFRAKTRGRSPVFARLARTSVDNLRMNGAGDAVMKFGVELGKSVHVVDGSVGDVSHRRRLDDVADDEFLDGFVLGRTPGAIGAPHRLHVTTPLLRPTVVSPLLRHFNLILQIS